MKQFHGNGVILGAAAFAFIAAQPAAAQIAQVTGVKLNPVNGGVSVVLQTSSGSRPQVFTTKRGNALVSDIINTQLRLPEGNNFRQDNPAAGIASVEVMQLDTNSIRVMVTGSNNIPTNQPVVRKSNEITLSFTPSATTASTGTPSASTPAPSTPEVMVPNPKISIDGRPAPPASLSQPVSQAPPFLPRAVAPPVGDIAISNTDASPSSIDLGTQERVPRLVLRDAPVREVLSLLARAAGMNLAYVDNEQAAGGAAGGAAAEGQSTSQTISLDIENEPVQDVFNYVLRLSGLEGNRSGRTIFVGTSLPNSTRDVVMRSMRLNQVTVGVALNYLVGLGAESAVSRERLVTSVNAVPVGGAANAAVTETQTTTETKIETQRVEYEDSTPLLRGLQALGDERTNSVTLVGTPRTVEMAMTQLSQLDIRRRQVVVNVRIIDVNLLGIQDSNSSFSFGIGNNFFSNDGGAATLNFGGSRPATRGEVADNLTGTPVTPNPLQEGNIFLNPVRGGVSSDPLEPGITEITEDTITYELPSFYRFPKRLLASLQTQVQNGNAKILTDPTLIVQEGQDAVVKLTSEVYGGIEITREGSVETRNPIIKEAGLTLAVRVDRIDDNGFVSLSVAPTVSAPGGSSPTPDGEITLLSARSLQSGLIRLRDGQTLILSGIIQESDRTTISKLPILGDIPLLGALFRSTNRTNQRNEVIVLLTPQIMDDSENSAYGYNYTPSPEVRQMLERRGLNAPRR
ncbi:AMIN domain-containing protein [Nodularia spumigena CS-591/04]|uniref:AMIN domain-containing protein n=1 Tax=Nodularia spumigena TaxID=70799 RepID=UPI00232B4D33|nr:AMIN domain-containing protein [Nodularia spumigena]MDB9331373.1 AMIN domain-containing protein [Nodularia spumigena CS-591/04]